MTKQELKPKAAELVKRIINTIADREYAKLASFAQAAPSWVEEGQTQEDGFLKFGEWLDDQLAVWEEYEEKTFVVDHFDETCLKDIKPENDGFFTTYWPTNSGEPLPFWFEIDFYVDKNDQISVSFNVNF